MQRLPGHADPGVRTERDARPACLGAPSDGREWSCPAEKTRIWILTFCAFVQRFSYITYLLASIVVTFSAVSEIRDIKLCELMIEQSPESGKGWRVALHILQALRQFSFLSWLIWVVISLVVMTGSDSMSICFNTVGEWP